MLLFTASSFEPREPLTVRHVLLAEREEVSTVSGSISCLAQHANKRVETPTVSVNGCAERVADWLGSATKCVPFPLVTQVGKTGSLSRYTSERFSKQPIKVSNVPGERITKQVTDAKRTITRGREDEATRVDDISFFVTLR
jgi:hypothetical protein